MFLLSVIQPFVSCSLSSNRSSLQPAMEQRWWLLLFLPMAGDTTTLVVVVFVCHNMPVEMGWFEFWFRSFGFWWWIMPMMVVISLPIYRFVWPMVCDNVLFGFACCSSGNCARDCQILGFLWVYSFHWCYDASICIAFLYIHLYIQRQDENEH